MACGAVTVSGIGGANTRIIGSILSNIYRKNLKIILKTFLLKIINFIKVFVNFKES
jgi:hypothetical protein